MLAQTRSTPFRLGFLARLYLLIAALVALLMLVAGTSLVAIGRLQGNAEQISSTASRLLVSESFFGTLQSLTQNLSDALAEDRPDQLDGYVSRHRTLQDQALELFAQLERVTPAHAETKQRLAALLPELDRRSLALIDAQRDLLARVGRNAVALRDLQLQFSRLKQDLLQAQFVTGDELVAYSIKQFIIPLEQVEALLFDAIGVASIKALDEAGGQIAQRLPALQQNLGNVLLDLAPHQDSRTDYAHSFQAPFAAIERQLAVPGDGAVAQYYVWLSDQQANREQKLQLGRLQHQAREDIGTLIASAQQASDRQLGLAAQTYRQGVAGLLAMAGLSIAVALAMGLWLGRTCAWPWRPSAAPCSTWPPVICVAAVITSARTSSGVSARRSTGSPAACATRWPRSGATPTNRTRSPAAMPRPVARPVPDWRDSAVALARSLSAWPSWRPVLARWRSMPARRPCGSAASRR